MADPITDIFSQLMNGSTYGIPNIAIILIIAFIFITIYLLATRKPRIKEFKPMIMKKETKRRFKHEYKYFGMPLNKNIYDVNLKDDENAKPIAYAIGYMPITEMKEMKRLEPVYTNFSKEDLELKHNQMAQQIYQKDYASLNEVEKKNTDEASRDELSKERIQIMPKDKKIRYEHGRKIIDFSIPVPMFALKVCSPTVLLKVLARFLGVGTDWWVINKDQLKQEEGNIYIVANFQRRTPFDIFVFSQAGKQLVEDISFGVERENIWQETANQIPRAVHFDTEASKSLIYRREDAKIEKDKHKAQTESHEFG